MFPRPKLNAILSQYNYDFSTVKAIPLADGHINKTYRLSCTCLNASNSSIINSGITSDIASSINPGISSDIKAEYNFVLQQINHDVFPKPVQLFENTEKINNHLLKQKQLGNYPFTVPKQLQTISGKTFCKIGGEYWRLMDYVSDSSTIENVTSPEQAAIVANSFAQFSCALSNFNTNELNITLDKFHDINFRLEQLRNAVTNNLHGRLAFCQPLVEFCFKQSQFINHVNAISKHLPLRVTHNDTKINNLLFDNTNKPIAVIDLDTCMPGYLMYDFGDMVRTCCSNLAEDDANIDKMSIKLDIFQALISSYQGAFSDKITESEKQSLTVGAKLLPLMVGIRFLTDFLNGDIYFNTAREKQNLDRATNQLHLYKLLCEIRRI